MAPGPLAFKSLDAYRQGQQQPGLPPVVKPPQHTDPLPPPTPYVKPPLRSTDLPPPMPFRMF